jgi:hypothetical protein
MSPNVSLFKASLARKAAFLRELRKQMFVLESRKLSGTVSPEEYVDKKAAIETAIKQTVEQ